jgi:hypothetical protein
MRAFDVSGVGFALLLVPLFGWMFGRFMGRRDWRIGPMLIAGFGLVLAFQLGILAVQCVVEGQSGPAASRSFGFLMERRFWEALGSPEFPVFLFIFGVFITMLGWSSTPSLKKSDS